MGLPAGLSRSCAWRSDGWAGSGRPSAGSAGSSAAVGGPLSDRRGRPCSRASLRSAGPALPAPRKIVGVNNLGQITFEWDLQLRRGRKVHHTLFWRNEADAMQRTNYPVSLDPEDAQFPELKPRLVS